MRPERNVSPNPIRARRRSQDAGVLLVSALAVAGCAPRVPTPPAWPGVELDGAAWGRIALELRASAAARFAGDTHERWSSTEGSGTEAWCRGLDGPAGCWGTAEARASAWRMFTVGAGPGGGAQTFAYEAGEFPPDGPWGARLQLALSEGGGEFGLELVRFAGDRVTDRVGLGRTTSFTIEQTEVRVGPAPGEGEALATLQEALASPRALTAYGQARIDRLGAAVLAELDAGRVQECSYHRYWGDGTPRCDLVPLPPARAAAARADAVATMARHREQLGAESAEIYAVVAALWRGRR